jgi:hypothetical protein
VERSGLPTKQFISWRATSHFPLYERQATSQMPHFPFTDPLVSGGRTRLPFVDDEAFTGAPTGDHTLDKKSQTEDRYYHSSCSPPNFVGPGQKLVGYRSPFGAPHSLLAIGLDGHVRPRSCNFCYTGIYQAFGLVFRLLTSRSALSQSAAISPDRCYPVSL